MQASTCCHAPLSWLNKHSMLLSFDHRLAEYVSHAQNSASPSSKACSLDAYTGYSGHPLARCPPSYQPSLLDLVCAQVSSHIFWRHCTEYHDMLMRCFHFSRREHTVQLVQQHETPCSTQLITFLQNVLSFAFHACFGKDKRLSDDHSSRWCCGNVWKAE